MKTEYRFEKVSHFYGVKFKTFNFSSLMRPATKILQAIITVVLMTSWASTASAGSEEISGKAADFKLTNKKGMQESLSDHLGEVVMVNFWASWCAPCREEMPLLDALQKKYERLGFTILGVNVEAENETAREMLKANPVSFPILFDTKNFVSEMMGVDAMPTTVLIDRNGNKRFLHRGYKPGYEDDYEKQIRALVRE
ncbi:MAG: TlpA family protein disulfide reductase [Pseudomonadales bacterium]|nr:TlpA family protein disulfide reductase [Pseudomonadales bacterium]